MSDYTYPWHWALNDYNKIGKEFRHWMYLAKSIDEEMKRLPHLFARERQSLLPDEHKQCSLSPKEPIEDNHLTCALGVECRSCPHLLAVEKSKNIADKHNEQRRKLFPEAQTSYNVTDKDIDHIKALTCISHLLAVHWTGNDNPNMCALDLSEGFILTVGDRMFWDRVYKNLSAGIDG